MSESNTPEEIRQHTKQNSTGQKIAGCLIFTFVGLVLLFWLFSGGDSKEQPEALPEVKKYTPQDALVDTQTIVEQRLVSPGSAQWAGMSESQVTQLTDSTFNVVSHVDSQNKFGGLMRSYYSVEVIYIPSRGKVRFGELKIKQR